jgi:hypothetical protein
MKLTKEMKDKIIKASKNVSKEDVLALSNTVLRTVEPVLPSQEHLL